MRGLNVEAVSCPCARKLPNPCHSEPSGAALCAARRCREICSFSPFLYLLKRDILHVCFMVHKKTMDTCADDQKELEHE